MGQIFRKIDNNFGYTLLEVLVSVGIIGILFVMSSAILINTISNTNKANVTNEARENASLVADTLERDIRKSTSATVSTTNPSTPNDTLTLTIDGQSVIWRCRAENSASKLNGYISRQVGSGTEVTVTNRDPSNGVSWLNTNCTFSKNGSSSQYLVTLDFTLTEGAASHSSGTSLGVEVKHQVSAGNRGF